LPRCNATSPRFLSHSRVPHGPDGVY